MIIVQAPELVGKSELSVAVIDFGPLLVQNSDMFEIED